MGSGKTSTGEALAQLLGWDFVDLDAEIEAAEVRSVRLFFQQEGETAFREAEHQALCKCLLDRKRPTVIALGGGAFVQENNVATLRDAGVLTVFLETALDEMLQRCGVEDTADPTNPRPLAADASEFRALYEKRLPHYRAAQVTIQTSGKSVEEVAKDIVESLGLQQSQ
ncbi:MAG: shikimate kinase [Candidatus Korobacteraceae bacterium]